MDWLPDLNRPLWVVSPKLPAITWWMILSALFGIVVSAVCFLMNKHDHDGHKTRHGELEARVRDVERRIRALSAPLRASKQDVLTGVQQERTKRVPGLPKM